MKCGEFFTIKKVVSIGLIVLALASIFTGCAKKQVQPKGKTNAEVIRQEEEEAEIKITHEIEGNNGYFVRRDNFVYFRVPTSNSTELTGVNLGFMDMEQGETAICSYNMEDGKFCEILRDSGYGKLAFFGDSLILQEAEEENGEMVYFTSFVDVNRKKVQRTRGSLIDVTENGRYLLLGLYSDDYENYIIKIYDLKDKNMAPNSPTKECVLGDFLSYITCSDYEFYYMAQIERDGEYSYDLVSCDYGGNKCIDLGEFPEEEFCDGPYACVYAKTEGGDIYIDYRDYEGTMHCYNAGFLIMAQARKSDSLTYEKLTGQGEGEEPNPRVVIDNCWSECDGIPGSAAATDEGYLGYYSKSGFFKDVVEGYYTIDYGNDIGAFVEQVEKISGKLFLIRDSFMRNEEEDIGWRQAYTRTGVDIIVVDIDNKEEDFIYYIQYD